MTTQKAAPVQNADLYEPETPAGEMVSLNIRMTAELRAQFAELCASRNVEMAKVIRRFIERELAAANAAK